MTSINEFFSEAANNWKLEQIYSAFEQAKRNHNPRARKHLTEIEKLYLRGILCGCSPREIARTRGKDNKGGEVYVSRNLYEYFKKLPDVPDEKVNNWRDIITYCEKCGYKGQDTNNLNHQILSKLNGSLPLDALIKVIDIGCDNQNQNCVTIDINIRLTLGTDKQEN
jgi:hypothetical protein